MTKQEFEKYVVQYASRFALEKSEEEYYAGRKPDFDSIFEDFIEEINDAVIAGVDDGMNLWDAKRPLSKQDILDRKADDAYTARKEGC